MECALRVHPMHVHWLCSGGCDENANGKRDSEVQSEIKCIYDFAVSVFIILARFPMRIKITIYIKLPYIILRINARSEFYNSRKEKNFAKFLCI